MKVEWDGEAFKKMENLKTLIIRNGKFNKSPKHLPNSIRVLECHNNSLFDLPSGFNPKDLVICNLCSFLTSSQFEGESFIKKANATFLSKKKASATYLYHLSYINKTSLRLFIYFLLSACFFISIFFFFCRSYRI
jgi:hypothetical protein